MGTPPEIMFKMFGFNGTNKSWSPSMCASAITHKFVLLIFLKVVTRKQNKHYEEWQSNGAKFVGMAAKWRL
jgi:hypothetical protein